MTIKFGNFANFIVRNFVVIWEAPNKWEAYCGTNRRRTAAQIGGVLRRFPFFKAWKPASHSVTNGGRTAVQIGDVPLPVLFRQVVRVGGS